VTPIIREENEDVHRLVGSEGDSGDEKPQGNEPSERRQSHRGNRFGRGRGRPMTLYKPQAFHRAVE
jgi:hypothetical protein